MANKHTISDLKQMQYLHLDAKIQMTKRRIKDWYEHWNGQVYVSFSGGKDSTVLKHIVDSMYDDVPALFVNTGLEYPEIQKFVKDIKAGKYDCFNTDVEIVRPELRFDEVIKKYGYPVVSKEVARRLQYARKSIERGEQNTNGDYLKLMGLSLTPSGEKSQYNCEKWQFLLNSDFPISANCCDVMKKKPAKQYGKQTGRKPIIGTMASESKLRQQKWIQYGCNAFEKKEPSSQPLSFWTEQDVLEYLYKFNVPYASVYGYIQEEGELEGQMFIDGFHTKLCTTGVSRTGCIFCMFGCHLEKEPNRFQRLKETHPRQYEYCIGGGDYVWEGAYISKIDGTYRKISWINDDESPMTNEQIEEYVERYKGCDNFTFRKVWQPNKEGLGLRHVLDYIGVKY